MLNFTIKYDSLLNNLRTSEKFYLIFCNKLAIIDLIIEEKGVGLFL